MEEMLKLVSMLVKNGNCFTFEPLFDGCIVILLDSNGKRIDDAVWHKYSYGHEKGLLESYALNDCSGYETAEEIFAGWKEFMS